MVRDRGLSELEVIYEIAGTHGTNLGAQQPQDLEPRGVGQGLEQPDLTVPRAAAQAADGQERAATFGAGSSRHEEYIDIYRYVV